MDVSVKIQQPVYTIKIEETEVGVSIVQPQVAVNLQSGPDISVKVEQPVIVVNMGCTCSGNAGGGAVTITVTAGEDLAARDLIYIAADGLAYKSDANDADKEAVLIIKADIATAASGDAYPTGTAVTGFAGLTPNARYFLSGDTPGAMSAAIVSAGIVQQVAKAISTTAVYFDPKVIILIPN